MSSSSSVPHVDDPVVKIDVHSLLNLHSAELQTAMEAVNKGQSVLLIPATTQVDRVVQAEAWPTIRTIWTWPWTGIDLITVLTGGAAFGAMGFVAAPHTPWVSLLTAALGMLAARVAKIFDQ